MEGLESRSTGQCACWAGRRQRQGQMASHGGLQRKRWAGGKGGGWQAKPRPKGRKRKARVKHHGTRVYHK